MVKPTISVRVVSDRLPALIGALRQQPKAGAMQSAQRIAERARSSVHVITGKTRNSIRAVPTANGAMVTAGEGALYEEFGTRYRSAHPFLLPAAEAERPSFLQKIKDALK